MIVSKLVFIKKLRWYDFPNYLLNHLTVGDHADCHQNISYGDQKRQKLDLYVPYHARSDKALIIFVHGGSWQHGKKEDYVFLAQSFAKEGFYVACVNYRFAPEHLFPEFVEDIIAATNYLQNQVQSSHFGYAAEHTILMGHSAGAFNVLSALYHPELKVSIDHLDFIRTIIGVAGPYCFEHRGDPVAQHAFDQNQAPQHIMPRYFVASNHVQHLLITADRDQLVKDSNTAQMAAALMQCGNRVKTISIKKTSHVSIIATVARGIDRFYPTKKIMIDFIDAHEFD